MRHHPSGFTFSQYPPTISGEMHNAGLKLLLAVIGLLTAEAVLACRVYVHPADRVNREFDAIVVGEVRSATYTEAARPDWHPWEGAAEVRRSIVGTADRSILQFGRSGSTAACDDGMDPPQRGEEWVFYLRRIDGALRVSESYPLFFAMQFDARLRGFTRVRP